MCLLHSHLFLPIEFEHHHHHHHHLSFSMMTTIRLLNCIFSFLSFLFTHQTTMRRKNRFRTSVFYLSANILFDVASFVWWHHHHHECFLFEQIQERKRNDINYRRSILEEWHKTRLTLRIYWRILISIINIRMVK